MSRGPRYRVPFRRRRDGATDYRHRLKLLLGDRPRAVVRISNKRVIVSITAYDPVGDRVLAYAESAELPGIGFPAGSLHSTPAAYLTGYLAGLRAKQAGATDAILDAGLRHTTAGGTPPRRGEGPARRRSRGPLRTGRLSDRRPSERDTSEDAAHRTARGVQGTGRQARRGGGSGLVTAMSAPPPSSGGYGGGPPRAPAPPWVPRTELGKRVASGEITTMSQALRTGLPLREAPIVDTLLPALHDEVLDVNMVQRMTDSGRRFKFAVTVVVGNGDGFVGLGRAKGKEVGPTIRRPSTGRSSTSSRRSADAAAGSAAADVRTRCRSRVHARSGSVVVTLKPAPRGVGLAVGDVAKPILQVRGDHRRLGLHRRPHQDDRQLRPGRLRGAPGALANEGPRRRHRAPEDRAGTHRGLDPASQGEPAPRLVAGRSGRTGTRAGPRRTGRSTPRRAGPPGGPGGARPPVRN